MYQYAYTPGLTHLVLSHTVAPLCGATDVILGDDEVTGVWVTCEPCRQAAL